VFVDPSQGVEQFLDDSYAVVGCRGGLDRAKIWDINIGVAFFNLQHPDFGGLIREWLWRIKWVPDTRLRKGKSDTYVTGEKGMGFPDDQQVRVYVCASVSGSECACPGAALSTSMA
jgi:hypothetical protein